MPLNGLERTDVKPAGGIVSVELLPASALTGAGYDPKTGCLAAPQTAAPFARYAFREGSASYREESSPNGHGLVRHTLTMEFHESPAVRKAVEQLTRMSPEGFAAVITTAAGQRILAGYSVRFGNRFPLRLAAAASDSGKRPADIPVRTVVLAAEDTEYSLPLAE